uniref:Uncharacterized protein n=1 Tax=Glossina palpalis gambiensis TaxID=67801 RepID=A0A1B0BZ98_9MUSC
MKKANMVRTSWIYNLKKDELTFICAEFEALNAVEEMRKALAVLAGSTNPSKETIARLEELGTKYTPRTTLIVDDTGSRANSSRRVTLELMSSTNAMNRMRKWSVKNDGDTNPLEFVKRIEELCETYDIPLTLMPKIVIELFTGQALMWYRNNRRPWADWPKFESDFMKFFLQSRYFDKLDYQIRQTYQQQCETFKAYAIAVAKPDASHRIHDACAQEGHYAQHCPFCCWECGHRGVLTKDCCRVNRQARPQFRGMAMDDYPDIYERTPDRPESRRKVICSSQRNLWRSIDQRYDRTIIKSSLQDAIRFVSEAPNVSTTIRMADGTLRHREVVTTVSEGETHFQLPLIALDDVVDKLTLGMTKAQATLVIGERAIPFGNTVQRPQVLWSGKPVDTVTNLAHGITIVRGPTSSSAIETKHDAFIGQAPTKRRDNALPTRHARDKNRHKLLSVAQTIQTSRRRSEEYIKLHNSEQQVVSFILPQQDEQDEYPWKLCVAKYDRARTLRAKHDSLASPKRMLAFVPLGEEEQRHLGQIQQCRDQERIGEEIPVLTAYCVIGYRNVSRCND